MAPDHSMNFRIQIYFVSANRPIGKDRNLILHGQNFQMDKLRRSFRSSFRRKEDSTEEAPSGPGRNWPADEVSVKTNTCTFEVKYLGNVEVRYF